MSLSGSIQQMRDNFEAQFEVTGDGNYLYRRNQQGEPIPVSGEEREQFVRQYIKCIRLILGGMIVVLLAFVGLLLWWAMATQSDVVDRPLYVGMGFITIAAIVLMYWAKGAPTRQLSRRAPVGGERSKKELRAILLRRISYGQILASAGVGVFIVVSRAAKEDLLSGWHRLWLGLGVGLVLLAAIQAFRKWRLEQEHPEA